MVGFSELILVLKFGRELFSQTQLSKVLLWFVLNILVSCAGVLVSMEIYKWRFNKETVDPTVMTAEEKVEKFLSEADTAEEDAGHQEGAKVSPYDEHTDEESLIRQRPTHQHSE